MKRILAFILALLLVFSLAACGDKDDNHDDHDYDKKDDSSSTSNKWKPSIKDIIANNQEDIEAVLDREIYVFKNNHPELYTIESANTVTSISYVENWTFGQVLNEENYKDIDWEVDTFESGSKVVTFTGKCQMTGYSETAVYNFYLQDGADFPIVTSIWLGPIEDISEAGPPLGYPTEGGDTELSIITTDARCSWWIALYSGGGIMAPEYDDEHELIITDQFAILDFCNMVNGVWVNKSSCDALDYGDVMFSFCVFEDEGLCFGYYPGEYGRVGKITSVEEIDEGQYSITLFYQEEEYFGDIYEESYEDCILSFDADSFQIDNNGIVYTYMGEDLDDAKQSVSDYLTSIEGTIVTYVPNQFEIRDKLCDVISSNLPAGYNQVCNWRITHEKMNGSQQDYINAPSYWMICDYGPDNKDTSDEGDKAFRINILIEDGFATKMEVFCDGLYLEQNRSVMKALLSAGLIFVENPLKDSLDTLYDKLLNSEVTTYSADNSSSTRDELTFTYTDNGIVFAATEFFYTYDFDPYNLWDCYLQIDVSPKRKNDAVRNNGWVEERISSENNMDGLHPDWYEISEVARYRDAAESLNEIFELSGTATCSASTDEYLLYRIEEQGISYMPYEVDVRVDNIKTTDKGIAVFLSATRENVYYRVYRDIPQYKLYYEWTYDWSGNFVSSTLDISISEYILSFYGGQGSENSIAPQIHHAPSGYENHDVFETFYSEYFGSEDVIGWEFLGTSDTKYNSDNKPDGWYVQFVYVYCVTLADGSTRYFLNEIGDLMLSEIYELMSDNQIVSVWSVPMEEFYPQLG